MGTASGDVACPVIVQDGHGAVGQGIASGQGCVHQQTGLGHGQAGRFLGSRSISRTTKKWARMTSVAVPALPVATLVVTQTQGLLAVPEALLDRPAQADQPHQPLPDPVRGAVAQVAFEFVRGGLRRSSSQMSGQGQRTRRATTRRTAQSTACRPWEPRRLHLNWVCRPGWVVP